MTSLKDQIITINGLAEKRGRELKAPMVAAHIAMLGATLQDDSIPITDEDWNAVSPDMRRMALGGLALVLASALSD